MKGESMGKITQFIQEKIAPWGARIGGNRYLTVIRNAMCALISLLVIGSTCTLLVKFPIEIVANFFVPVAPALNAINSAMTAHLAVYRGKGYVLETTDEKDLNCLLREISTSKQNDTLPSTPEERKYYLLNDLLWRSDWVTLDTLASILCISRRTISYDMRVVEDTLISYGLTLESRPYAGIHVKGSELSRRICLAGIVTEQLASNDGEFRDIQILVRTIGHIVESTIKDSDFQISSLAYQNLLVHLIVAVMRVRSERYIPIGDISLDDIQQTSSWDTAKRIVDRIGTKIGIVFPEQEVGYIALTFAVALERKCTQPDKKNIIVACASGAGSARLLEIQFKKTFGNYLDRVITCDVLTLEHQDFQGIDYVFSTVPIPPEIKIPVPILRIGFFLDGEDNSRVRRALTTSKHTDTGGRLWLDPRLFFPHLDFKSRDAVLHFLCSEMERIFGLDDNFEKLVFQREQVASTAFGNLIAVPHPIIAVDAPTAIAVGLLNHKVIWDDKPVRAIFLVNITSDPEGDLSDFYRELTSLFTNHDAIQRLLDVQDFSVFVAELERQ